MVQEKYLGANISYKWYILSSVKAMWWFLALGKFWQGINRGELKLSGLCLLGFSMIVFLFKFFSPSVCGVTSSCGTLYKMFVHVDIFLLNLFFGVVPLVLDLP